MISSTQITVAVLGAGPAGLILARILQRNGVNCIVYEKESSKESRDQGGTLDLHPQTGQKALISAGLFDQAN